MGEVYRAEHELAGRPVALEPQHRDFAEDPNLTQRFFQEAQVVGRVRHPNIVDVLDAAFSEQGPYLAMECLDGASLFAR
jgi:serine/threonine-protein kinase